MAVGIIQLGDVHLEDAILILGGHVLRVSIIGKADRARLESALPLLPVPLHAVLLLSLFALALLID